MLNISIREAVLMFLFFLQILSFLSENASNEFNLIKIGGVVHFLNNYPALINLFFSAIVIGLSVPFRYKLPLMGGGLRQQ